MRLHDTIIRIMIRIHEFFNKFELSLGGYQAKSVAASLLASGQGSKELSSYKRGRNRLILLPTWGWGGGGIYRESFNKSSKLLVAHV